MSDDIKSGDDLPTIVIKLQDRISKLEAKQSLTKTIVIKHGNYIDTHAEEITELKDRLIEYPYIHRELHEEVKTELNELKARIEGIYKSVHGIEPNEPDMIWKQLNGLKDLFTSTQAFNLNCFEVNREVLREFIIRLEGLGGWDFLYFKKKLDGKTDDSPRIKTFKKAGLNMVSTPEELEEFFKTEKKDINDLTDNSWKEIFEEKEFTLDKSSYGKGYVNGMKASGGELSVESGKIGRDSKTEVSRALTDSKPPEPYLVYLHQKTMEKKENNNINPNVVMIGGEFVSHLKDDEIIVKREDLQFLINWFDWEFANEKEQDKFTKIKEEYGIK